MRQGLRLHRLGEDRGETLIELLATIVIMSTAVVAIIGATATSIHLSDIHRKQAKAGAYLRQYAEAVETKVAGSPTGYKSCAVAGDYTDAGIYAAPAPYNAAATDVQVRTATGSWGPSGGGCADLDDLGAQRVTLQVTLGTQVTETLAIVIRRPCRPADTSDASCV